MIKVSLKDLKDKFNELIDEKLSREEISNWASKRMFAEDDGLLEYDPSECKPVIWSGIKYLIGVDLVNPDGNYFHVKEDFIDYKKRLFDDKSDLVKGLFERSEKFQKVKKELLELQEKSPDKSEEFFLDQLNKTMVKKGLNKNPEQNK